MQTLMRAQLVRTADLIKNIYKEMAENENESRNSGIFQNIYLLVFTLSFIFDYHKGIH